MAGAYNYSADFNPQFEFGHGLSYTTFEYSALALSDSVLNEGGSLTITVDVTNAGEREGKEAVLLFISDVTATLITPDVKRLRGFEKISLQPGETKKVSFQLRPEDIAFVNHELETVTEPGEFRILTGGQEASFVYKNRAVN